MIHNIIVVSDLHCGCRMGLCPPEVPLDDGGTYRHGRTQEFSWACWQEFWGEWVPHVTHGEPYAVVVNGDAVDGVHHNATTQISHNMQDQRTIARMVLEPVRDACDGRLYLIRGTEAHVGKSGVDEEAIGRDLRAVPNQDGQHARWDLRVTMGDRMIHFLHHIGTTGSNAYEGTAVSKELTEEYNEAARWGRKRPDCIVRSHRHRNYEIRIPTDKGFAIAVVTPAWQGKTPFAWRSAGARLSEPQFGGILIRLGDEDLYTRSKVWSIEPTKEEEL